MILLVQSPNCSGVLFISILLIQSIRLIRVQTTSSDKNSLISVTTPVMALAAAVNGLAKKVRELGPCLPSKFLLEVDTQYLPAGILSSFIPRHALQPGSRSGKPAASNPRRRNGTDEAMGLRCLTY